MGVLKLAVLLVIYTMVLVGVVLILPFERDFTPQIYIPNLPTEFKPPLGLKDDLDNFEKIHENELVWPESLALSPKGDIYTGVADGTIRRLSKDGSLSVVGRLGKECAGQWEEHVCGRPLGMRFAKNGALHVVDAYHGYHILNTETGKSAPVLPGSQEVETKKLQFLNDLDLDPARNKVYISQSSTKYSLLEVIKALMEYENSGRLLQYDMTTKKVQVLARGLYFPNGVQLSKDGSFVMLAESGTNRILKYDLNKGSLSVLIDKLPGTPDNIRPSTTPGQYWVVVMNPHVEGSFNLLDLVAPYPIVRTVAYKLSAGLGHILTYIHSFHSCPSLGYIAGELRAGRLFADIESPGTLLVKFDESGKILATHGSSSKLSKISEVLEHNGHFYLGSWRNNYLAKAPIKK